MLLSVVQGVFLRACLLVLLLTFGRTVMKEAERFVTGLRACRFEGGGGNVLEVCWLRWREEWHLWESCLDGDERD